MFRENPFEKTCSCMLHITREEIIEAPDLNGGNCFIYRSPFDEEMPTSKNSMTLEYLMVVCKSASKLLLKVFVHILIRFCFDSHRSLVPFSTALCKEVYIYLFR